MNGVQTRLDIKERPYGKRYTGRIVQKHNDGRFAYYLYDDKLYIVDVPYSFREEMKDANDITVVAKDGEYMYHSSE